MHIYKITNLVNGKIYVGQTVQSNPKMRWYSHLADARSGKRKGHLQNSLNKYGPENFSYELIDQASSLDDLNTKEKYWLDYYKKIIEVYNIREAGDNKLHSQYSISKMQESQKKAHARRRAEGREGGWKRIDGGGMKGKTHPRKGTKGLWNMPDSAKEKLSQIQIDRSGTRGKTWKTINGKRVYFDKGDQN